MPTEQITNELDILVSGQNSKVYCRCSEILCKTPDAVACIDKSLRSEVAKRWKRTRGNFRGIRCKHEQIEDRYYWLGRSHGR